jgi:CheY-like chemotaxis protein
MDPLSNLFSDAGELAGCHGLVVDDQDDSREMLTALLETCGMTVTAAASGNLAYVAFRERRPHILISDIWMPDGDGCELVRRIRTLGQEEGGLVPAIAISGGASHDESLEAGFHCHFRKPVEPLVLLDCVRDFVRTDGTSRAKWSLTPDGGDLLLRYDGHVTGADMREATVMMSRLLEESADGYRLVVDLRDLTGWDPSVAAVGQAGVWRQRHKLRSVLVVGGSITARLVARTAAFVLGLRCSFADELPR